MTILPLSLSFNFLPSAILIISDFSVMEYIYFWFFMGKGGLSCSMLADLQNRFSKPCIIPFPDVSLGTASDILQIYSCHKAGTVLP